MTSTKQAAPPLEDAKAPVKTKLSAPWTSLLLCYVDGDYFGLYRPGWPHRALYPSLCRTPL